MLNLHYQEHFCGLESIFLKVLIEGVFQKFNITFRILEQWTQIDKFFNETPVTSLFILNLDCLFNNFLIEQDYDISLSQMNLDSYMLGFSDSHWVKDEYNLVIISAHFTEEPNMMKIFQIFSFDIWLIILLTTICLTIFFLIYNCVKSNLDNFIQLNNIYLLILLDGSKISTRSFGEIYFQIIRYLVIQQENNRKKIILLTIWSSSAMILTNVFSSGVLTSLMFQEETHFNSLDELFSANVTLLNYNNSWIWYQFDNHLKYGSPLDDNLDQLKKKLNFLTREMIDSEVSQN